MRACLCAYKSEHRMCVCRRVYVFKCAHMCLSLCVCMRVHATEAPVAITAHRRDSDLILWSPSLTCQHPAGHVVHLHTVSLCSLGICSHTKCVHFCICMRLYVCARLLEFDFVCVSLPVRQVEGQVLMAAASPSLLPSPREKQACARCPVNNHPSVLPGFASISLSFHPAFPRLINFVIQ